MESNYGSEAITLDFTKLFNFQRTKQLLVFPQSPFKIKMK